MKFLTDPHLRRDFLKLLYLSFAVLGLISVFLVTPALSGPTLISVLSAILLSPSVSWLERRGFSRGSATGLLFVAIGAALGASTWVATAAIQSEWNAFRIHAPELFRVTIARAQVLEASAKLHLPFLNEIGSPTQTLLSWGESSGRWFVDNGAALAGSFFTWAIVAPFLTFVLLNEGLQMRRRFFSLVPNRYFESFFLVSNEIMAAISDYLRAKLVEALLVGTITGIGLFLIGAPYALVLGLVAGVTNILPYVGPLLGAAPGVLVALFDPAGSAHLVPIVLVYVIANVVDTVVIFPLIVAKLVNLHPLILITAVIVGQQYYGLVGMLLSIPIAASLKIILGQIHRSVYDRGTLTLSWAHEPDESEQLKVHPSIRIAAEHSLPANAMPLLDVKTAPTRKSAPKLKSSRQKPPRSNKLPKS